MNTVRIKTKKLKNVRVEKIAISNCFLLKVKKMLMQKFSFALDKNIDVKILFQTGSFFPSLSFFSQKKKVLCACLKLLLFVTSFQVFKTFFLPFSRFVECIKGTFN